MSSCTTRPRTAIISLLHHHICLPLIQATPKICYPYTPTHPLPLNLTPIYLYLSIYLFPLTHFISPISLNHSLSLYFSSTYWVYRPLTHFITIYSWTIHYLTIYSLYLYFLTICITYTLSLPPPGNPLPPSPLWLVTKSIVALTSSHWWWYLLCTARLYQIVLSRLSLDQIAQFCSVFCSYGPSIFLKITYH